MEESKQAVAKRKLEKVLDESFLDSVKDLSDDDLKNTLVKLSQGEEKINEEKEANATLNKLKEDLKALNGGYSSLKKLNRKKLKYVLLLLDAKA